MTTGFLLLFPALFISPLAFACVWNSSVDPTFIRMSSIPVCINAPSESDRANSFAQFREAETTIRNAVRDLGERSALNLSIETGYCQENDETPRQPKIRISLAGNSATYGQAFVDRDGFPTAETNVLIPHLTHENSQLRHRQNIAVVTQHEILHLLGIRHDHRFGDSASIEKLMNSNPSLRLLGEMNPGSIMNFTADDIARYDRNEVMRETLAVDAADIQCIQQVLSQNTPESASPPSSGSGQVR